MPKILAIDPGSVKTAYILLDRETKAPLEFGKILNTEMREELIAMNFDDIQSIQCEFPKPRGQLASTHLFETVMWIGRYTELLFDMGYDIEYFDRKDVKMTICGTTKANDSQIRSALIDIYGGERIAIGGKKCKTCNGKGYIGRDKTQCHQCNGAGVESPKGPLRGISEDVWAALGIAISYIEMQRLKELAPQALNQK